MLTKTLSLIALTLLANAKVVNKSIQHPDFEAFDLDELSKDSFFEQFADEANDKWKISQAMNKETGELLYDGEWSIEESSVNPGFKNDYGLVVKSEARRHGISRRLPTEFDNVNSTLVLQYEVKLQNGLDCGGAYIKLLNLKDGEEFDNESNYQIMFGPDKCGTTNRIHFIINRLNPITKEYEEKHLLVAPMARVVKTSTLYTLLISPNQDFEIRINGDIIKSGSLLNEKYFTMNPPKYIDDPTDFKPDDWVDEEMITDPNDTKPDDWDEDEPYMIHDTNVKKPADWDEDAPEYILDPDAEKPEYWDDDEDGEWKAPKIANPYCEEHGCGKWYPPRIRNPNFKGKWQPNLIENPNYKGEWTPKLIENPDYYEDLTPSNLEKINSIGFELWTMNDNILFDNIYLGHSIAEAEFIGNSTFLPKVEIEELEAASNAPKSNQKSDNEEDEVGIQQQQSNQVSVWTEVYEQAQLSLNEFSENLYDYMFDLSNAPVETISKRPLELLFYSVILLLFSIVVCSSLLVIASLILVGRPAESKTEVPASSASTTANEKSEKIEESKKDSQFKKHETEVSKR